MYFSIHVPGFSSWTSMAADLVSRVAMIRLFCSSDLARFIHWNTT